MNTNCSYPQCQVCSIKTCWTGEVARTQGIKGYEAHLKMLDEAEELLDAEKKNYAIY